MHIDLHDDIVTLVVASFEWLENSRSISPLIKDMTLIKGYGRIERRNHDRAKR